MNGADRRNAKSQRAYFHLAYLFFSLKKTAFKSFDLTFPRTAMFLIRDVSNFFFLVNKMQFRITVSIANVTLNFFFFLSVEETHKSETGSSEENLAFILHKLEDLPTYSKVLLLPSLLRGNLRFSSSCDGPARALSCEGRRNAASRSKSYKA